MSSNDPFAIYDKTPAFSFAGQGKGYKVTLRVLEAAKLVQGKDFDTNQPAVWKNKDGSTSPKMSAVIKVEHEGQSYSLWAIKPSSLFVAIGTAQREAGQQIAPGGELTIEIVDEVPSKRKGGQAKKEYGATYAPKDAFESSGDVPY